MSSCRLSLGYTDRTLMVGKAKDRRFGCGDNAHPRRSPVPLQQRMYLRAALGSRAADISYHSPPRGEGSLTRAIRLRSLHAHDPRPTAH
jgi:hypothetical protein